MEFIKENFALILNTLMAIATIIATVLIYKSGKKHDVEMYRLDKKQQKIDSLLEELQNIANSSGVLVGNANKSFDVSFEKVDRLLDKIVKFQNRLITTDFLNDLKQDLDVLMEFMSTIVKKRSLSITDANDLNNEMSSKFTNLVRTLKNLEKKIYEKK
ncbi:MAG: hypothetical protein JEZ05_01540 [Tenericutes bacterium]|nr:hypothetical protein [Mycoplasmatota bacterium]